MARFVTALFLLMILGEGITRSIDRDGSEIGVVTGTLYALNGKIHQRVSRRHLASLADKAQGVHSLRLDLGPEVLGLEMEVSQDSVWTDQSQLVVRRGEEVEIIQDAVDASCFLAGPLTSQGGAVSLHTCGRLSGMIQTRHVHYDIQEAEDTDADSDNFHLKVTMTRSSIALPLIDDTPGDDTAGDDNTGDDTAGDDNTGDDTTGDDNTGDDTTGDDNTGDDTTGDDTTGDDTTGDDTTGGDNTGDDTTRDDTTRDDTTRDDTTGDDTAGDDTTEDDTTGDDTTGDDITGDDTTSDDTTLEDTISNDTTGDDTTGDDTNGDDATADFNGTKRQSERPIAAEIGVFLDANFAYYMSRVRGIHTDVQLRNWLIVKWNLIKGVYGDERKVGVKFTLQLKGVEIWRTNPAFYQRLGNGSRSHEYLDVFCQYSSNSPNYDHKMLYTQGTGEHHMGMAYLNRVCRHNQKCSFVKSKEDPVKIELHEFGHNLGFRHDPSMGPCFYPDGVGGFMGWGTNYEFLNCYRRVLLSTIREPGASCLYEQNVAAPILNP